MKSTYDARAGLKKFREQHDLSQVALSEKLGYSHAVYGHWETGRTAIKVDILVDLADFYNITIDELIGRRPINKAPARSSMEQISLFD